MGHFDTETIHSLFDRFSLSSSGSTLNLTNTLLAVFACGHTHFRREEQKQSSSFPLASSAAPSVRYCTVCEVCCWWFGCVHVTTDRERACCDLCVERSTVQSGVFFVYAAAGFQESRSMTPSPSRLPPRVTERSRVRSLLQL